MPDSRKDLLDECYSGDVAEKGTVEQFKMAYCRLCRNTACVNSAMGKSKWQYRMDNQQKELLDNPTFADPEDPAHEEVRSTEFPDASENAVRQDLTAQRVDWTLPSADEVTAAMGDTDPIPAGYEPPPAEEMENVIWETQVRGSTGDLHRVALIEVAGRQGWVCSCRAFQYDTAGPDGCRHIQAVAASYVPEEEVLPPPPTRDGPKKKTDPVARQQMRARNLLPTTRNTVFPPGGIMIDGSAPPEESSEPEDDPWAIKTPQNTVPIGGSVTLKEEDD